MEDKIKLGSNMFVYPMAVTLVGTHLGDRPNFTTVSWLTRVNVHPPMIAVSLNPDLNSTKGILQNREFSINYPGADMADVADMCGILKGPRSGKAQFFDVFNGELTYAPMIREATLSLELTVHSVLELPSNVLVIGKIVNSYSESKYLTNGKPDVQKMDPLALTMPDNRYWRLGDSVGKAWYIGRPNR